MAFLDKLLPSRGLICVAEARPGSGFRHYFYKTVPEAQKQLDKLDAQGRTMFVAQAGFDEDKINEANQYNATLPRGHNKKDRKVVRGQVNAQWMRNFFLDIDCGEGKDYPTQVAAAQALKKFVTESGLPKPAVMNSGNGLYAHWILDEDMPAANWKTIARLFKDTVLAYGFDTDPVRTADSASVLRPPGTHNRKNETKPVKIERDMEPVSIDTFVEALKKAAKKKKVPTKSLAPPKEMADANADFYSGIEPTSAPSHADPIADKCSQLRTMRETKGDLTEPLWYAGLGVLVFCEEGDSLIQEWSSGHEDYSAEATTNKVNQWKDSGIGPTTCAHYGSLNPKGCLGCPHKNKIKSPIVLGRPEPKALEIPVEECEPPRGFRRTEEGLSHEEDERWAKFYDQDLYPSQLSYDESLGYQVVTIRHHLPHEGWLEFTIRSSLVADPKGLLTVLWDNHVIVAGSREKKLMAAYLEGYIQKLQRNRKMNQLLCQMGWKIREDNSFFVLGKRIYCDDGSIQDTPMAKNVPSVAKAFGMKGELQKWTDATALLDKPGAEPFAFALLAGGFGAPLMKFSGFDGALVSLVGESGVGKTLLLRMIQSVWGNHKELMLLRDDTKNMLVSRLGIHGTTPVTIDEVTNIEGRDLSDLVYRITQGRDKGRLTKNAVERANLNYWNTLAVVTTNSSLVDKLSGAKADANAEINRVFEYTVPRIKSLEGDVATELYWTIDEHYGLAGDAYTKWLVTNIDKIKPGLDQVREWIDTAAGIKGEERFWSATAATAIYGGMVAQKLGLIKFDVARVMKWAVSTITTMRDGKESLVHDSVGILGQFLDEYLPNRIVVGRDHANAKGAVMISEPRGSLVYRQETHTNRIFLSRSVFKRWLAKRFGSYTQIKTELIAMGALKNANARKTLGANTEFSGAQVACWEIDISCPHLGSIGFQLIEGGKEAAHQAKPPYRIKTATAKKE